MHRSDPRFLRVLVLLLGLVLLPLALAQEAPQEAQQETRQTDPPTQYRPDVRYTLTTGLADGRMAFIGVGGDIDGVANPTLTAEQGQVVQITLINGDNVRHDVFVDGIPNAQSELVYQRDASTSVVFRAEEIGTYQYWCTVPGHRLSGMEGTFVISEPSPEPEPEEDLADIVLPPDQLPGPIGDRSEPITHEVTLEAVELVGRLADGTSYRYWTFNRTVPGPFLRVRVGDTIDVTLTNAPDSVMVHSVDLHSVTGPGGGAVSTQALPGETKGFSFKALQPGLYIYHCATPMVAHHITNGMYGMILVEPEGGLPPVDKEFYVMQGELYTHARYGEDGYMEFDVQKLLDEDPEYFVFNGAVGALSAQHPLTAEVGDTVRIFFGVGGPNFTSSFHVIGEIFDRVYDLGSLTAPPLTDVQTALVPPGGSTMVEFTVEVPGNFTLVDHALSRAERGLVGTLQVTGEPNPEIYDGEIESGGGH